MSVTIGEIRLGRPKWEYAQDDLLRWLAKYHESPIAFFRRFGCNSERIAKRGSELKDFGMSADPPKAGTWNSDGQLYLAEKRDLGTLKRTELYEQFAVDQVNRLYADREQAPHHIFHVTCTGYSSPSAVQRLVQKKRWYSTATTHCYHMGCYAALPAIRLAQGLVMGGLENADIVHTEYCTLHLETGRMTPEQAVIQSLFSDGSAQYSVRATSDDNPGLEVISIQERLLPESEGLMSWKVGDSGAKMTLAREVPDYIAVAVRSTVEKSLQAHDLSPAQCIFAIHPGGPRIIDLIQDQLRLEKSQVRHSRDILLNYGNMSSSTLPYIWKAILDDTQIETGMPVVSLAFGPGLTFFWSLMRKK